MFGPMERAVVASAFRMEGAFDDVVVRLQPGAAERGVIEGLNRLLGPYGLGFGWFAPELQERLAVPRVNWFAVKGARDFNRLSRCGLELEGGARRFDINETANFLNLPGPPPPRGGTTIAARRGAPVGSGRLPRGVASLKSDPRLICSAWPADTVSENAIAPAVRGLSRRIASGISTTAETSLLEGLEAAPGRRTRSPRAQCGSERPDRRPGQRAGAARRRLS
jgi:hypothetical protein